MPTSDILTLLIAERDKLTRAIEALAGSAKRRGRPPKSAAAAAAPAASAAPVKRKRRKFTAAQRAAFGARMRSYWARRRKKG
ncbi:MAG: hypothetical protein ABSB35_16150 [Bryobacteraceae bacterium]